VGPLSPHSPATHSIASVFSLVLIIACVVFLVVVVLVALSIVRYRSRGRTEQEPRQVFGSPKLETLWTLVPLAIVTGLFIVTVRAMVSIDAPQNPFTNSPDLVILGRQWWWEARYSPFMLATGDIHIPAGHRVLVDIVSSDVIHDFWVPQLARKIDAVPGLGSYIWLEADAPGVYQGACSEFCGAQHAWMRFRVIADSEPAFKAWLKRQAAPSPRPTGLAVEGERLFQSKKCADCHTVSATDRQTQGPNLAHLASRELLGGGIARNTPENLTLWLTNPQAAKPGNRMPDTPLSSDETGALLAYLESLQ
jgi:cytochrome c oxidase subunit II